MYRCRVTKVEGPTGKGIDMAVFGGRKGLANKVDDGMTTSAKFTNDLELASN